MVAIEVARETTFIFAETAQTNIKIMKKSIIPTVCICLQKENAGQSTCVFGADDGDTALLRKSCVFGDRALHSTRLRLRG